MELVSMNMVLAAVLLVLVAALCVCGIVCIIRYRTRIFSKWVWAAITVIVIVVGPILCLTIGVDRNGGDRVYSGCARKETEVWYCE